VREFSPGDDEGDRVVVAGDDCFSDVGCGAEAVFDGAIFRPAQKPTARESKHAIKREGDFMGVLVAKAWRLLRALK
jgi:hypothetical protein